MNIDELLNEQAEENKVFIVSKKDLQAFANDILARANMNFAKIIKEQNKDKLVSTNEACALLKKSRKTLWEWAKRGYLIPVKRGSQNYYRMEDIQNMLNPPKQNE